MSAQVLESITLPEFNFSNREREIGDLSAFLGSRPEQTSLLLLTGDGGVGKSRLISELITRQPTDNVIIRLNFTEKLKHIGLISSLRSECERLQDLIKEKFKKEYLKLKTVQFFNKSKTVLPSLGKLLPYGGDLAKQTLHELLNVSSSSQLGDIRNWANYLSILIGIYISEHDLSLIIDDYHALNDDEKSVLIELIGGLVEDSSKPMNIVISTRKINHSENDPINVATRQASESGQLNVYNLLPLNDKHMLDIARGLFSNPAESKELLESSKGNPQDLRNTLINLNISGQLKIKDHELILPSDTTGAGFNNEGKWELLTNDSCMSDTALTIALYPLPAPLEEIINHLDVLERWSKAEVVEAIDTLKGFEILDIESKGLNQPYIDFSHDVLREEIVSKFKQTSLVKYLYLSELSAEILKRRLEQNLNLSLEPFFSYQNVNDQLFEHFTIESIDILISLASIYLESKKKECEPFVYHTFMLCNAKGYKKEANNLGLNLLDLLSVTYSNTSQLITTIKSKLVVSLYELGSYSKVIEISSNYQAKSEAEIYAITLSIIIEKKEANWIKVATDRLNEFCESSHSSPLLQSVSAIALRENNETVKGEAALFDIYNNQDRSQLESWYKFLSVAAIYLPNSMGVNSALDAIEYHQSTGNVRVEGLTYTNLGIMYIREGKLDLAFECFQVAEEKLKSVATSDVIFPILNKAAIHMIRGEFNIASSLLKSCFFRNCPQEELLSIHVNLAIAEWEGGKKIDLRKLENLTQENTNSWLQWMATYNAIYIKISGEKTLSDDIVFEYQQQLKAQDPNFHASFYWNNLMNKCFEREHASKFLLPSNIKATALDKLVKSEQPFRPIFLSFGHV